jgi:hypothetical protein
LFLGVDGDGAAHYWDSYDINGETAHINTRNGRLPISGIRRGTTHERTKGTV